MYLQFFIYLYLLIPTLLIYSLYNIIYRAVSKNKKNMLVPFHFYVYIRFYIMLKNKHFLMCILCIYRKKNQKQKSLSVAPFKSFTVHER